MRYCDALHQVRLGVIEQAADEPLVGATTPSETDPQPPHGWRAKERSHRRLPWLHQLRR
jgi:hypothetical protein